ncbi:MAG: DNA alkylation repair protein [Brevefilum sp.]|nr:DNA alkylation repair protein [Brevefilum sp.]
MTAVNPTRLRFQILGLMATFDTPVDFHHKLQGLFSLYANYALRFGEDVSTRPLISMYHLPHPVIRQLTLDLKTRIAADPAAALAVADELWRDEYYEVRHTAIRILGNLPLDDPQPVLERLRAWLTPDLDQALRSDLFTIGTRSLQEAFPQAWEALILTFLTQTEPKKIALGIQALSEGAKSPTFKNLPTLFRLASPFIRDPHSAYTRDLEDLVETLVALSPHETAYFLKQILAVSNSPETARLVKNCLSAFPEEIQADLKSSLQ